MSGKRFYSPGASGPGYSQMYRSSGSRPRASGGTAGRVSSLSPHHGRGSSPGRRYVSPSYLRGSLSPGRPRVTGPSRSLAVRPGASQLGGSTANTTLTSPADVQHMLTDLVEISEAIATYISQDPSVRVDGNSSVSQQQQQQQQAMLKAQEIERIVKRVEAHFLAKMNALQTTNRDLERQVELLTAKLRALGEATDLPRPTHAAHTAPEVREGLRQQEEALDELDKTWGSLRGDNEQVDQLRRILVAEKRQRLLVEEQTQMLTEQHAKVVGTLEKRLRKQEDQLRDLISALDRNGHSSAASPPASVSGSPENSSSAVRGATTPRHLLRQQLAQHQQTQRALQAYQEHLANGKLPVDLADDTDDLGFAQVQRTLDSIKNTQPLPLPHTPTSAVAPTTNVAETTPVGRSGQQPRMALDTAQADVDEISAFLDNITKELESISGGE